MEWDLFLLTLLPLGYAGGCPLWPPGGKGLPRWGVACALLHLLLGLYPCLTGTGSPAYVPGLCGEGLGLTAEGVRLLLIQLTNLLFLVCALWAVREGTTRYWTTGFAVQSGVLGVFLAADLFTLLVFFELMSLVSALWIYAPARPAARRAGDLYLAVGVLGGLFLLAGTMLLANQVCDLTWTGLSGWQGERSSLYPACLCLLVGFGAKAGAFPLHIWMPSAYAVAPPPAAALLSGVLSKAGWLGLLLISTVILPGDSAWGRGMLALGGITLLVGGIRAVLAGGLQETLAYSSMAQTGFLLLGVALAGLPGPQRGLALGGALLFLFHHAVAKTILFLLAGQSRREKGGSDRRSLQGGLRKGAWRKAAFFGGGLPLCGLPLTSGYLGKTFLHESLAAAGEALPPVLYSLCEGAFLLGGGCTVAYLLKLWAALFCGAESGEAPPHGTVPGSRAALLALGVVPLLLGTTAPFIRGLLVLGTQSFPLAGEISPGSVYTWHNLQGVMQAAALGAALYVLLVRLPARRGSGLHWPRRLSLERLLYRPLLLNWLPKAGAAAACVLGLWPDKALSYVGRFFNGSWDRETPRRRRWEGVLKRGEGQSFRHSLSWSWLLFLCGVCLVVSLICLAVL